MNALVLVFAVLSIWDYPDRHPRHVLLSRQFVAAARAADRPTMEAVCRKGMALLPDEPSWPYNLACSIAAFPRREDEAFDALEQAIDLGFRNRAAIEADVDLRPLAARPRFKELVAYAERIRSRPILLGPAAVVDRAGVFGKSVALGEQNLGWDFVNGCFVAHLKLVAGTSEPYVGALYMNRDGQHSALDLQNFPGLTAVTFDAEGRRRKLDRSVPNVLFPYPTFGNASLAMTAGPYWRSLPRALMTMNVADLGKMMKFYSSNQIWVFPSHMDTAPVGTNGDVFASVAPYWLTTAGRSWSDRPYLRAALKAFAALDGSVRESIVSRNLLAPTIQALIRKALTGVSGEDGYLTAAAHPTALPPDGLDLERLLAAAGALTAEAVPPVVAVRVAPDTVVSVGGRPELTYGTNCAWAFVLRSETARRTFVIEAQGAEEYAFAQTHGENADVTIERLAANAAKVSLDSRALSPTNRVDITVVGKTAKSGWGAPSYVSFARTDPTAPYSDPVLTPPPAPPDK